MSDGPQLWEDAGFEFDEGDSTVGIVGGWAHWCSAGVVESGDPSIDIAEGWSFDHFNGEGVNRFAVGQRSLVCNECGANVSWEEQEWDPEVHEHDDLKER